jgi:hypothetical protein
MTCWFEPLILRLGPRSSRYDSFAEAIPTVRATITGPDPRGAVSAPRVCRRSPSTDALARNAIEGPARVSAVTRAVEVETSRYRVVF